MSNPNTAAILLEYFDKHKRDLPWRGVNDAYKTWLSEIMLQQTTVKSVMPYYTRFITLFPTLESLALAPLDDILREWAGLGYYSRARNLHKCANEILHKHGGFFPQKSNELIKLTGIGAYTSAAIAAIAFHEPIAVVDGNVERVWGRFKALQTIENVRKDLQNHVPLVRPGDFAEMLMDLGATICTPRNPACGLCPLNFDCLAYKNNEIALYPAKKVKVKLPEKRAVCFIIMNEGRVLVETRPDKGMLGGMTGLPCSEWVLKDDFNLQIALKNVTNYTIKNVIIRHIFTHFALELTPVIIHTNENGRFIDPANNNEPFPTLFKKVLNEISLS
jgi:A/G-specific adenine glycosylase